MSESPFNPIAQWKVNSVTEDGRIFPDTEILAPREGARVRQRILSTLGLGRDASNREALDALYSGVRKLTLHPRVLDDIPVENMLEEAKVVSDRVLLLFPLEGGFDSAVIISRRNLIDFFDDLWYPSVDDLLVIDAENEVLLMIDHHENVGTLAFGDLPNDLLA
jgi:hypothetical protein